ncbi:hypothetical protein BJF90_42080 [Pseudonocardia sp. CNS-004]|nr:hypothetical protein BJF90_42080 [Pseudonocardia sp. CNS-004]
MIPLPSTVIDDLVGIDEAQIAQLAPGRFEVRVVPGRGFDADANRAHVLRNIERLVGPGQDVTIRLMDRIPRSAAGKLRTAVVLPGGMPDGAGTLIR